MQRFVFKNLLRQLALVFVLSATIFSAQPKAALALGVTPVSVNLENILKNTSVERSFFLSRSNPDKDEFALVTSEGDGAFAIRLPNKGIVKLPKGLHNTPFTFFVEPGNAPRGQYTAFLRAAPIEAADIEKSQSGSRLLAGARFDVRFSVSSDIVERMQIVAPALHDTEEGQIFAFSYRLMNTGNIDIRVPKLIVDVSTAEDKKVVYHETIESTDGKIVKPMAEDVVQVPTQAALKAGLYFAHLKYYKGDQLVYESEDLKFKVYPRGTLRQEGELISFTTDQLTYDKGQIVQWKASFKNAGQVDYSGALDIEIKRNGETVDVLKTSTLFIPARSTVEFRKSYLPKDTGSFQSVGSVSFGANKTQEIQADFTVKAQFGTVYILVILSLLTILLAIILRKLFRRPVS